MFILNDNRYTLEVLQKRAKLYKNHDRKVFVNSNHNSSLDKESFDKSFEKVFAIFYNNEFIT